MSRILVAVLALVVGYAISWAIIVGIIKLITMCFSIGFSLPVVTGIWLILREMDGEPAYIPETNCWVLVTKNPFVPLFTWPDGEQCSAYDWYEQVGPVYRRPPEGEDGDANHA